MIAGLLVEVTVTGQGSMLTADVTTGTTVLPIEDVSTFSTEGGTVELNGVRYDYSTVDETASTMKLLTGLATGLDDTTPVELVYGGEVALSYEALVDFEDGDALPIPIGYEQRDRWAPGAYEPPVPVLVQDDYSALSDAPGRTPVLDGSMIDPTTLPDPSGPVAVPPASPAIIVTPMATGFMVTTQNIDQTTQLQYRVDGVSVITTRATAYFVSTTGTGATLLPATDYSLDVLATNVLGDAPAPSNAVVAQLDPNTGAEFIRSVIRAGLVFGGSAQFGNITIDPDTGITIPLLDGGIIHFPSDGSPATISAKLRAAELDVAGHMSIKGDTNTVEGQLAAANGVVAPTVGPTVTADWAPGVNFGITGLYATSLYIDGPYAYCGSFSNVYKIDKATGAGVATYPVGSGIEDHCGIVQVGSNWYVMVAKTGGGYEIRIFDSAWTYLSTRAVTLSGTGQMRPHLMKDDWLGDQTIYRISYFTSPTSTTAQLRSQAYVAATGATSGAAFTSTASGSDSASKWHLRGSFWGWSDTGSDRFWVLRETASTATVMAHNVSTGAFLSAYHFNAFGVGTLIAHDVQAGTFYSLDTNNGILYKHATGVPSTATRSVTYTWFDNDGTTHETPASPATSFSQAARRWMRVSTPPPADGGDVDDPNAVRIYVANSKQADLAAGVTTALYEGPTTGGATAPVVNNFPATVVPGEFRSTALEGAIPWWWLKGDGSWRLGHLAGNANGTNANDTGWIAITPTSPYTGTAAYRRVDGIVYLRGSLTKNAAADGSTMFTLPVGYRPTVRLIDLLDCSPATAVGRIDIAFATGIASLTFKIGTPTALWFAHSWPVV